MFEYTAELTYPIPENVTGGLLTTSYNFFGFVIFILCYIPGIGEIWVDWALCLTCLGKMILSNLKQFSLLIYLQTRLSYSLESD